MFKHLMLHPSLVDTNTSLAPVPDFQAVFNVEVDGFHVHGCVCVPVRFDSITLSNSAQVRDTRMEMQQLLMQRQCLTTHLTPNVRAGSCPAIQDCCDRDIYFRFPCVLRAQLLPLRKLFCLGTAC